MRRTLLMTLFGLSIAACAGPTPNVARGGAQTASLGARSSVACHADTECGVCFRSGDCGQPIAAADPALAEPSCHASPPPFCMPRHPHCEDHVCVAH